MALLHVTCKAKRYAVLATLSASTTNCAAPILTLEEVLGSTVGRRTFLQTFLQECRKQLNEEKMIKHTPGNWSVAGHVAGPYCVVSDYIVENRYTIVGHASNVKDAHLIAAAPDLLKALQKMLQRYGYETCEYVLFATAAIAKANGKIA